MKSAFVNKITQVKQNEMLLLVGMSMKIQTKIQNQQSIFFNTPIMIFNGKFWCQDLWIISKEKT